MKIQLTTPLSDDDVRALKSGDSVLISGEIYTGRDAAHLRLVDAIKQGKTLPFNMDGAIIYYVGPAPAKPDAVIGSAGPTTSYRMDDLTEPLLNLGLKGMIGKGQRSPNVIDAMKLHGAVYFAAIGGAGALIAKSVIKSEIIAYDDLGTEAIRKLTVKDFPAIVVIDSEGNNLYHSERKKYSDDSERIKNEL